MTKALKVMLDEGHQVPLADIATLSPYITRHIQRFGEYALSSQEPPVFDEIVGWEMVAKPKEANTTDLFAGAIVESTELLI